MLSTTIVHVCARCGSERTRENGHANNGAQRARCLDGERTFIPAPEGARYSPDFREQVLAAYQDRMNIRGIQRTFGVCYQTVMKWLEEKWRGCPRSRTRCYPASTVRARTRRTLELRAVQVADALALGGALSKNPPDRRLHVGGSQPAKRSGPAGRFARRLPPPSDPPRPLGSLRGGLSGADPPLLRQRARRNLPRRTLVWHPACAPEPLGAPGLLLFQAP